MNSRSRSGRSIVARAFTIAAIALALSTPALAQADAVALLPVRGSADAERREAVEQLISEILVEQGHRLAPPSASTVDRPPSSARMEEIGAGSNAVYVVAAEVAPLPGQYQLAIHVFYRPAGRMEELVVGVLAQTERERLSDVLGSMVRAAGLGEDALRLTEEEDPEAEARRREEEAARLAAEEAARLAEQEAAEREAAEQAQRDAEEAARLEAEAQARRDAEAQSAAEEAWNSRVPYGADGEWMAQLQLGGGYALTLGQLPGMAQGGGGMFVGGLRVGRSFEGVDGFELRGGIDFQTGAFSALGIHVGAAWLGSPFTEPVFIGLSGEVGVVFTLTGARDVGFSARVAALFAYRPLEHFYLEVAIPEIGLVTPGAGAVSIGASAHVGYRF